MRMEKAPLILIVDDDDTLRDVLVEYFSGLGYAAMGAPDGRTALKMQARNPADLVITDLIMPEENGLETIIELKRHDPHVKIIAMTGSGHIGSLEDLKTASYLGAELTFAKPFQLEDLLRAVKELLQLPEA